MNFLYELYSLFQFNFLSLISEGGRYFLSALIASILFSLLLAFSTSYLVKLWHKKYNYKTIDYFFIALATFVVLISSLSIFGLEYYQDSKNKLFSRVWYNELTANKGWQDNVYRLLENTDMTKEDKLLNYTKAAIGFLNKKSPILMRGFSKEVVQNHHVQSAIDAMNKKHKYYIFNDYLPKDAPKVLEFLLAENVQQESNSSMIVPILLGLIPVILLFLLFLSPVFYSAYKDLKLYT